MDTKQKKRRFLVISNIVISVLAAAAIICCFILPLWKVELSVLFTDELGNTVKQLTYADKNDTGVRYTSAGRSVKAAALLDIDSFGGSFSGSGKELINSFVDALCEKDLQISFTGSFSSADMIKTVFDNDLSRAEALLDKMVDSFITDTEKIIGEVLQTALSVGVKEAVRQTVDAVIKADSDAYEEITKEFTQSDKDKIDDIIDSVIGAIMDDNATVDSVTETVLESADDIQQIIAGIDRFKEDAELYDDEMRASLKENAEELLKQFADEDGRLNLKDTLVSFVINAANEALENVDTGSERKNYIFGMSSSETVKSIPSLTEASDTLKAQVKTVVFNAGDGIAAKFIVLLMAVSGVLLAVFLFMLFYPILRTLTNISAENPGFSMFLPIFGGLTAFTLLVILPSVFPGIIKSMAAEGGIFSFSADVMAVLNAVSVKFSSGTLIAFVFAAALFVFSFFYEHQRRSLKKELAAAQPLTAPEQPQQYYEPAQEQYTGPQTQTDEQTPKQ